MDWYGTHARRIMSQNTEGRAREEANRRARPLTLAPIVEVVSDPLNTIQTSSELLEKAQTEGRQRSSWMQRLRRRSRPGGARAKPSGTVVYEGRLCCYEHLTQFEGRAQMVYPFETTCENCGAVFRIHLGVTRR